MCFNYCAVIINFTVLLIRLRMIYSFESTNFTKLKTNLLPTAAGLCNNDIHKYAMHATEGNS